MPTAKESKLAVETKVASPSASSAESPKFQLANLFSTPRSSMGGAAPEMSGAAVRRAGGWRTNQWAPMSSKSASSSGSVEGQASPRKQGGWNDKMDSEEGSRSGSVLEDIDRDSLATWEQHAGPSVMTPPGAINELPSFSIGSPAVQNQPGDIPWSASISKTGDYDWANFVYAYARGRWDPVRLPHPPGQSNIVLGASTHIGVETESFSRPATPEAPEENFVIRRPSLTYSAPPQGTSSEGHLSTSVESDPYGIVHARTPPPSAQATTPAHLDNRTRAKSTILNDEASQLRPTSSGETSFVNPFNVLQLASNSAPNVNFAKAEMLGKSVQSLAKKDAGSPQGSKTDTELIAKSKGILSRHGSDNTQRAQDDTVWQDSSLFGPTDRHAGVLPFVSPTAPSTQSRPGLDARMSELVLNKDKMSNDGDGVKLGHSLFQKTSEPMQRPRPTPVQHLLGDSEIVHTDTWSSAPDAKESGSSTFGISSHSHMNSDADTSTVSGLRRAARRTSIKRGEASRDASSRELFSSVNHSKSFPAAGVMAEAMIREVPSLDKLRQQECEVCQDEVESNDLTRSSSAGDANEGVGRKIFTDRRTVVDSNVPSPDARSRTNSDAAMKKKRPTDLSQIGQSNSNPSMSTYLSVGRNVEQFYKDNGYLPAIIPPDEQNRRQALRRYGPPNMHGDSNFDRIGHLVKLVFNTKLVLISLVGEKSQFFQTEVGATSAGFSGEWLQQTAKSRDCSICSHAILQQTDEALVILDAQKDWRFAGNPLVKGPPHIRFYAGSPLRTSDGYNLGSLCIIDDRPWQEFSPRQRHTLKEFSRVVMREMELSRDTIHLRIRDRMQHSIETFTRECLEMETSEMEEKDDDNPGLHKVYAFAAKGMREALNASGAIIFDLSHFELVVSGPQSHDEDGGSKIFFPSPYQYPDITPFANFEHPETIEGVNSATESAPTNFHADSKLEEKSVPPMAVLGADEAFPAPEDRDRPVPLGHYLKVAEFLRKYRTGHYFPFIPAPFRHLLPAGMTNILLVPIFGLNKQPFALLCAYSKPGEVVTTLEDIEEPGLQYLRAMGTIILSAILKKDIMLADKAKSHFISNISHELRTPLHGILAAAELLAETKLNSTQGSYLETVEACGKSLLELVNHVLDFTKLSGNMRANQPQAKPSQRCDLVKLVQEVCESSWIGQMAKKLESEQNSGIGSAYAKGSESSSPDDDGEAAPSLKEQKQKILTQFSHVETVIDISFRSLGWLVKCDAGGIRRVLMNLIGNSLKFTSVGFVHVSVREVQSTETHVVVEMGVTDTGKGISRTFLEEQLFHPFTQENHLGPGTGLGLSIVNSIVQSPAINGKIDVWSTLGQGTEIRVTCELELSPPTDLEGSLYRPTLNVNGKKSISLIGFQDNLRGQSDLKDVLRTYFEEWWNFEIAEGGDGDLVLINDEVEYLVQIAKERRERGQRLPPVIFLTGARGDGRVAKACDDYQEEGGMARLLFKPAGPARLEAITEYCLQCLERANAGKPMCVTDSESETLVKSPAHYDEQRPPFTTTSSDNKTPLVDDTPTPRGHAAISSRPHRPHLNNDDLRRNSHHISPGPPSSSDEKSLLLRRHSSGDRISRAARERAQSPSSSSSVKDGAKRPVMPSRAITYHEPNNLQRHVLMSPLRSPHHLRKSEEATDYFGVVAPTNGNNTYGTSSSSHTPGTPGPSSPGSVISLEGGEGAVLKTAIHNAGLLRGGITKKRLQVLGVEDNSINRKVLAAYFGKLQVDYVEAVNGEDGVKVFESYPPNHFDIIFMDLSMPVLDGLGATKQIRRIEAERFRNDHGAAQQAWSKATKSSSSMVLSTPGGSRPSAQARAKIFTLTGRSSDEDKRRAFATGADGFIVKPLSFKVLSSLLTSISAVR